MDKNQSKDLFSYENIKNKNKNELLRDLEYQKLISEINDIEKFIKTYVSYNIEK